MVVSEMLQRASKMLPKLLLLFSAFIVCVDCREFTDNNNNNNNNNKKKKIILKNIDPNNFYYSYYCNFIYSYIYKYNYRNKK